MYRYYRALDVAVVATLVFYLWLAPYSKVEESFTTQAIHDVANYGLELNRYDHFEFPGVVPRTFVGSVIIGLVVKAAMWALQTAGVFTGALDQQHWQFFARLLLGLANLSGFFKIRSAINSITSRDKTSRTKGLIGFWFTVILVGQFHVLYYSTRFLPNFVALPLVLHAMAKILQGDLLGLTWLAFTGVVFRLEIGVFAGIIALVSSLIFGQSNIFVNVVMLLAGTASGLVTLYLLDSYMWGINVVPELAAFSYNVLEGHASNWGVSPFATYFTLFLPAWFRPPVVLMLILPGFFSDPAYDGIPVGKVDDSGKKPVLHPARHSLRILTLSSLMFLFVMSFQPHKEWRFVIYTAPVFMLQAANSLSDILIKAQFLWSSCILLLVVAGLQLTLIPLALIQGYVSSYNYPGGDALAAVNSYILTNNQSEALIHIGVASCMTGASRFGQLVDIPGVVYDKTEDETKLLQFWNDIDYLLAEANLQDVHSTEKLVPFNKENWEEIHVSSIFSGINTQPVYDLVIAEKGAHLKGFAIQVVHELTSLFKSNTFANFFRSIVATRDIVHVWKRIAKDDLSKLKLASANVNKTEPDIVEVVANVENAPEFEEVVEEVNEAIDELEQ